MDSIKKANEALLSLILRSGSLWKLDATESKNSQDS